MDNILFLELMHKPLWMWIVFLGIVSALLVFDLGILQRKVHEISIKESLSLSLFYIVLACGFGTWVWYYLGSTAGKEYFTGYIIEKTLSLDNVFVMSLIFSSLHVPRLDHHRVLLWGIMGVILLRALMIWSGAALISNFYWVLYVFAVILMVTGIKMLVAKESDPNIENSLAFRLLSRYARVTKTFHGQKFFVRLVDKQTKKKALFLTPLMLALIMIEFADLIFALDSVPAIFTITQDPYIVYTSNIFAVLGLRSLYFALAAIVHRFHYLKPALALVLIFIGSKLFIADLMGMHEFPASISLGVTLGLIFAGIAASILKPKA